MDYNEILLQAIDTVIETRLQGLQYDKTVKAQIVEDLGNGAYTVSENSSVKYEATVSSDTSYSVNDYVHVLIPSGDYTNPKVIVGKYTEDNASSPVVYLQPLDSFVAMAEEMQMLEEGVGIKASASGGPTAVELGTISLAASTSSAQKYNSSYSALGISCNFKALFNGYDMVSGNYGLRFYLLQDNGQVAVAEMDSSSWFGNPYGYYSYGNQTFVFDISNIKNIQTITVVLYQKANFYYLDANNKRIGFETEYANIFAKDLVIQLGQDVTDIVDNTFTIAAVDGQENYSEGQTAKEIIATWYNKDEDNRYIGFSDGIVDTRYDEDAYADKLEEEYLGGFEAYSDIAPLRESYGYHKTLLKISSLYDNLEEILTNLYNNVVKKAADFLGNANKTISDFYDNKLEPYQESLAKTISSNETYFNNREKAMTADYKVVADGGADVTEYSFVITGIPSSSSMWSALQTALVAAGEDTQQIAYFELLNRKRAEYKALYDEITFELGGNLNRPDYVSLHSKLMNFYRVFYTKLSSKNLISFEEEYAAFVEDYKNRYCIYWYRVNLEATDRWLGDGWERIAGDTYPNVAENGETYLRYNRPMSTVDVDAELDEMKFKAILFYNHDMFESNILTLDNLDIPSEPSADISSALRVEHGTNSQDFYQKYGSNYVLLKYSDSMTNRQIKVQYNGLEEGNEALDGNIIYWYVPQINSMLEVWENNLLEKGFSSLAATIAANNEALEANGEYLPGEELERILRHERTGYACYYKVIASHENEEDISFYYQIAKVYNPMHTNNIVYCVLDRDGFDYEGQISFSFATYDTAGTDYTLAVVPTGRQAAIEQYDNKIHPLQVIGSFTGYNGATVEDTPDLDFKLAAGDESAIEINALSSNGKTYCAIGLETIMDSPKNFVESNSLYNILKVSTNYKDINMATYLPVAISFGKYYLKGTSIVSYDNFGSILSTSNIESYELYDRETNELVEDVVFTIQYYKSSSPWSRVVEPSTAAKVGAPELKIRTDSETNETTYTLSPTTMYITGALNVVVVAWKDDEPLFAQPIYVYKDQWGSSLLNGWDGNLVIDEKNNYILSAMMGAGYKDTDNTFNGVLMGDISVANLSGVGLYGFNKGTASFGLDYRGTAFFGKSGSGQIIFDGNNGTIISGNYSINRNTGMMIDLEEGHIDAYNFRLTSNRILMDSSENASTYFRIYDEDKNVLIYIGPKSYYLQDSSGNMKIDLANGKIKAEKFELNAMSGGIGIKMTAGDGETTFQAIADANNKIDFSPNRLLIKAGDGNNSVIIDSKGPTYFKVGNTNNFIQLDSSGLDIKTKKIVIDAWEEDSKKGVYINSAPGAGQNLFSVGFDVDNYISFDSKNNFIIRAQNLFIESQTETARIYIDTYTDNAVTFSISADVKARSAGGEGRFFVYKDGAILLHSSLASGNFITLDTHNTNTESDWPFSITDNFRIDWDGNVEANALYLQANGSNGFIYFHSKDEIPSSLSARRYLRYEDGALLIMNTGLGSPMMASNVGKFDTLVCLGEKTGVNYDVWGDSGQGVIRIMSNVRVTPYQGNTTFTFAEGTQLIIKDGAQLIIEGSAGTLDLINKGIVLKSSENDENGITIENAGSSTLKISNVGTVQIGTGMFKLSSSAGVSVPISLQQNGSYNYISVSSLLATEVLATPTFWVGTIKDSSGTTELMSLTSSGITIPSAVTFSGSVNGNEKGFGKLAFADSVKKNFDISVSGDVTLEVDVSEYYTADKDYYYNYDYSIESGGGSGTVTFTHDASKDGQTETYTYNYDIYHGYSTKVYYTKATTKSVTKNVTLKGNTDLELEPSDTDTGTETIEITGTQQ